MLVKQINAAWVGVKINGWCANKEIHFEVTSNSMDKQLIELKDNQVSMKLYAEMLKKGIQKQDHFPQKQNMLNYLEGIITNSTESNIAAIKMGKFRKDVQR